MPHPIIQAEVDEFNRNFMNNGLNGVLPDEFQDTKMIIIKRDFIAALHRAIERAGREMVGEEQSMNFSNSHELHLAEGYNAHRSLALSKLDTIINFKEK